MKNWHARLKELREKKGLSKTDLADKMGIHLSQVSKYESGHGSSRITGNLKYKLLDVFTPEEVKYLETGTWISGAQNIIGNNNNQAGRDQIIREAVKQVREEDMAQIHDAIVNAIIQMMQGFDEEQKIKVLQCITEIKLGK